MAMGERPSLTSSLIGGDLGSGAGSKVTEHRRREMLACDWFMSDGLTKQGGEERCRGGRGQGITCMLD